MQIEISEETAAMISQLAEHLENLDGNPRGMDDVIQFAITGVASVRPDIAAVINGGN